LAKDREAQSKLWIVPNQSSQEALIEAQAINDQIQMILNTLDYQNKESAEYFLNQKGIFFDDHRTAGVGDLYTELYVGYHPDREAWYSDVLFGVRIPTGKRNNDPSDTLYMTTGNNGHVECSLGTEDGWQPRHWFAMRAYLSGNHVCKRTEKRAVRFKGSTIRNIGPAIDVAVSYNYVRGFFEMTFYHPEYSYLGCSVGYDLYARGRDNVCCLSPICPVDKNSCGCASPTTKIINRQATDLLGFLRTIDCSLYACETKTMTHTVRGDVFVRLCSGYVDLFGGGSYAGRYAMKTSEVHMGVTVNF
jgi:hypothetical protein